MSLSEHAKLALKSAIRDDGNAYTEIVTALEITDEAGYLNNVVPGTSAASKCVVLDATSKIDTLDLTAVKLGGVSMTCTAAELNILDAVTAGAVSAGLGVVVDSNKDIGDFRNLDAVNIDAGVSGTAGTVDVFPTTASKGKLAVTAADSAGDTTTTLVNASQAGARTYTVPDAGANAEFVMMTATGGAKVSKGHDMTYSEYVEEFRGEAGDTLPDIWDVNATTGNSTEDYVTDTPCGGYTLTQDSTSEGQSGRLSAGDNLWINLSKTPIIEMRVKVDCTGTNTLGSADQRAVFGIASALVNAEDTLDDVPVNCWFRIEGVDSKIYVECDDGGVAVDTNDQDSGVTLVDDTWMVLRIDFTDLSAVAMYIDGVVQSGAAIDMSSVAANTKVQPLVCIQRDAGDEEEKVYIDYIQVIQGRS
jgi:hypothetical protein